MNPSRSTWPLPVSIRPPYLACACLLLALVAFGVIRQPSAARPLLTPSQDLIVGHHEGPLLEAAAPHAPASRRQQAGFASAGAWFSDLQLLATLPETDEVPAAAPLARLRIRTIFVTHRVLHAVRPVVHFREGLAPNASRVVVPGRPEVTLVTERLTLWNELPVGHSVVSRVVVQRGRPAVVVRGAPRTLHEAMTLLGARGVVAVYSMIATAYTADSAQAYPTGRTATGLPARFGVVAVDPHVIPLGAHLFVEGYGPAIAADTGGAIRGYRIDLCMDSFTRALQWGRQPVRVYLLRIH